MQRIPAVFPKFPGISVALKELLRMGEPKTPDTLTEKEHDALVTQ